MFNHESCKGESNGDNGKCRQPELLMLGDEVIDRPLLVSQLTYLGVEMIFEGLSVDFLLTFC